MIFYNCCYFPIFNLIMLILTCVNVYIFPDGKSKLIYNCVDTLCTKT